MSKQNPILVIMFVALGVGSAVRLGWKISLGIVAMCFVFVVLAGISDSFDDSKLKWWHCVLMSAIVFVIAFTAVRIGGW